MGQQAAPESTVQRYARHITDMRMHMPIMLSIFRPQVNRVTS